MFKQAFRSYMASLHPRNFRKIKDTSSMFIWCFYWLLINPIMNGYAGMGDAAWLILFWITKVTPFVLIWWSNLTARLFMPKIMYLSPMKTEDRKEYFSILLMIKIVFPVLVGILLHLVRGMVYGMDWLTWLELFVCTFSYASFGIGMYVCSELYSKFDRYIRYAVWGKDGTGKDAWLNWICMIDSFLIMFLFSMNEAPNRMTETVDWIWLIGGIGILVIMDIVILKTRYHFAITDVCDYEKQLYIRQGKK